MMIITLSPMRMDVPLALERKGSVLTLNGVAVDLVGYDAEASPCPWIVGQPFRGPAPGPEGGEVWHVTLILPHDCNAPAEALYPGPLMLRDDGPLALPGSDTQA